MLSSNALFVRSIDETNANQEAEFSPHFFDRYDWGVLIAH